jgi:hypothetical protein
MPGSFDLDNSSPPLASDALQVGVYRYDGQGGYTLIPNVRCLQIEYREGPDPPTARFEYMMDDALAANLGWPSQFEQLWPIDAQGPYVVSPDDRIVVMAQNPDHSNLILFDGFAQIPQVDLGPVNQRVTFAAVGVAVRAFDLPISGRVQRDSDPVGLSDTTGQSDVQVDLPCRFNPADTSVAGDGGYLPNRSPDGGNTVKAGSSPPIDYPVFIDPGLERSPDPRAYWDLADAVKYLMATENADQKYVKLPTFNTLDALLQACTPADGHQTMDPSNPSSFVVFPITVRDYDASNKGWPAAVAELVSYAGTVMRFDTDSDDDGNPTTELKLYRRDQFNTVAPKLIYLDAAGSTIDPSRNNVVQLNLARDANAIVNAFQVETNQRQVEVSIILAPLYQPAAADAMAASTPTAGRNAFKTASLDINHATAETRRKYRWYGADECGDGHWTQAQAWDTSPFDFSAIFPPDDDGTPSYTARYRPGSRHLISLDSKGDPLKADLSISFTYEGDTAAPWDGTATDWLSISHGWRLLKDRLGIEVTVQDPEDWSTGNPQRAKIDGITWWAAPPAFDPTNSLQPILRLTTVIEDDLRMPISANKRVASPTQFTRFRSADGRDHFQYASIDKSSLNYLTAGGNGTDPVIIRDDTRSADTHAEGLRAAHEMPPLAGSVTIPYITQYYEIGDRIRSIDGRNVSLQTSVGADQGESPTYPCVVGLSWNFESERQTTTLQLSDRRAERINL